MKSHHTDQNKLNSILSTLAQPSVLLSLFAFAGIAIGFLDLKISRPSEPISPQAVAYVNGTPIPESALLPLVNRQNSIVSNELRMEIIDTLIDEELALQEVKEKRLMETSTPLRTEALRELSRQKALKEGFLPLQESDLEQFYQQNAERMAPAQALQIDLIYVQSDAQAQSRINNIRSALVQGNAFMDVAQQLGDPAPFLLPRSLTPLTRLAELMPKPLLDLSKKLSEGAVSDAVAYENGWYFLHVIRRQDGNTLNYDVVRPSIAKLLEERALQRAYQMRIEALRNRASIRIVETPQPEIKTQDIEAHDIEAHEIENNTVGDVSETPIEAPSLAADNDMPAPLGATNSTDVEDVNIDDTPNQSPDEQQ